MDFFSVNLQEKKIKEIENERVMTFSNPLVFQWPPYISSVLALECVSNRSTNSYRENSSSSSTSTLQFIITKGRAR